MPIVTFAEAPMRQVGPKEPVMHLPVPLAGCGAEVMFAPLLQDVDAKSQPTHMCAGFH